MFEFILRHTIFRKLNKEEQEIVMLLKYGIKIECIARLLVCTFGIFPMVLLVTMLIVCEHTLSNTILCGALGVPYVTFEFWFLKKFKEQVEDFIYRLWNNMHFSQNVIKGNAISKSDFDIIKQEDERLHYIMMTCQVRGYCYNVCFDILKCLKKGTLLLVAVKQIKTAEIDDEEFKNDNEYTMHALYVNNEWCFDTWGEMQYPLEEVMKRRKTKVYKSYCFDDIKDITYEQFRKEEGPELRKWCNANDCYLTWSED